MKSVGCVTDPGDTEQYYHALRNLGAVGAEQWWRIFYQTFCCVYLIWRPFVVSKLSTQTLFPSTSSLIVIFSASSTPCTSLQYKITKIICNSHFNCNKLSGIFLVDLRKFKREKKIFCLPRFFLSHRGTMFSWIHTETENILFWILHDWWWLSSLFSCLIWVSMCPWKFAILPMTNSQLCRALESIKTKLTGPGQDFLD